MLVALFRRRNIATTFPESTPLTLSVLALVVGLIAFRRIGRLNVGMWQAMALGAGVVLVTGQISLGSAARSVNLDVIAFLFGMFVVAQALEASGYLADLSVKLFDRADQDKLVGLVLVASALGSTVLMNDTVAILGTPIVLLAAKQSGLSPVPLLLALAFGVTIGGVMSPIGNPQNLLVATEGGIDNPFIAFARHLALPSLVNVAIAFVVLRLAYRRELAVRVEAPAGSAIEDRALARIALSAIAVIVALIVLRLRWRWVALRQSTCGSPTSRWPVPYQ